MMKRVMDPSEAVRLGFYPLLRLQHDQATDGYTLRLGLSLLVHVTRACHWPHSFWHITYNDSFTFQERVLHGHKV